MRSVCGRIGTPNFNLHHVKSFYSNLCCLNNLFSLSALEGSFQLTKCNLPWVDYHSIVDEAVSEKLRISSHSWANTRCSHLLLHKLPSFSSNTSNSSKHHLLLNEVGPQYLTLGQGRQWPKRPPFSAGAMGWDLPVGNGGSVKEKDLGCLLLLWPGIRKNEPVT